MLIDGKKIAQEIQAEIKAQVNALPTSPCLAVIIVGHHPASMIYVKRKIEACQKAGIRSLRIDLPNTVSKEELVHEIQKLNNAEEVDGILVQLPLPFSLNPLEINAYISPEKDVDGLHPLNMGKLLMGEKGGFIPCTPLGVQTLILRSGFEIAGKHVVILGRSLIVGKPLAALLIQTSEGGNATVTVLHSRSQNIKELTLSADIIIAAIGQPKFLTKDMVKKGAIVIDVGINRTAEGKIVGDTDYEALIHHAAAITPVPGGVGPMTIAMLLSNTLKSYLKRHGAHD